MPSRFMPLLRIKAEVVSPEPLKALINNNHDVYLDEDESIIYMPERGLVVLTKGSIIEVITEFGNAGEAIKLLRELNAFNISIT